MKPVSYFVRTGIPQDIPVLADFLQQMASESEAIALDRNTVELGISRVFQQPQLGQYWVLENRETAQTVGMCMITFEWSDWHNRFYWWFQSVYIHPDFRGQGLLKILMEAVESKAHAENGQELRLYVESSNQRAIRAYEKLGYQRGHYAVMQKQVSVNSNQ